MNLAIHGIERQPRRRLGRHLRPRPAPADRSQGRLRHGQPAVQHQGLGAQRVGPALALRRAAGRQRQLRLDPAHPLQARPRRHGRRGDGQRLDVIELRRRGRDPRADRRGRPGLLHGRPADPAVPVSTGIPVCLWFFAKDKTAGQAGLDRPDRAGAVHRRPRTSATWSTAPSARWPTTDIAKIADTYHAWRGTASAREAGLEYADEPGFCYSATLAEIKAADYALTPGRYVGAAEVEDDGEPIEEKIERLTKELYAQFDESERLSWRVRRNLERVDV